MIITYITAILIILAVMSGWIGVQALYRRFSARHPELGFASEDGEAGGCGMFCFCKNRMTCPKQKLKSRITKRPEDL